MSQEQLISLSTIAIVVLSFATVYLCVLLDRKCETNVRLESEIEELKRNNNRLALGIRDSPGSFFMGEPKQMKPRQMDIDEWYPVDEVHS
jgi:uncharacterized protein (DUF2141 family)